MNARTTVPDEFHQVLVFAFPEVVWMLETCRKVLSPYRQLIIAICFSVC